MNPAIIETSEPAEADRLLIEELQARMAELQRISQIGVWYYVPSTDSGWWSGETFKLFGLAPDSEVPNYPQLREFIHPHDREKADEVFERVLVEGVYAQHEFRVVRPDGVTLWLESRMCPTLDSKGKVIRIDGTNQDITIRKIQEMEIRERDLLLQNAFDNMLEGLHIIDFDYRFRYVNQVLLSQFRAEKKEILGRGVLEAFPQFDRSELYQSLKRCMEDRVPIQLESTIRFDDGLRVFQIAMRPVPDGVLVLSNDVTDRCQFESELRANKEIFGAFFESSNVGMVEWNTDLRPIHVNEAWCQLLGYSRHEFMNLSLDQLVLADHLFEIRTILEGLAKNQHQRAETRCCFLHKDRSPVYTLVHLSVARRLDGVPKTFASVIIDITKQVELAEQVRHAHRMEAVGRLAGGVAHDFNNILTVVVGSCELLDLEPAIGASARSHLEAMKKAAHRGAGLTKQLLTFSRRRISQLRSVAPNSMVRNAEPLLSRLIGESIRLEFHFDANAPFVLADTGHIEQILINLVMNARDAMPESGVIRIETIHHPHYPWRSRQNLSTRTMGAVEFAVSDNGSGMPPEILDRMSEPQHSRRSFVHGAGLGLAIVHGIVEQLSGEIYAESRMGQGTTIRFFLPVANPKASSASPPVPSEPQSVQESILIVDDEELICDVAAQILSQKGYRVRSTTSPWEAIALIGDSSQHWDLALIDVVMPEMSGLALVKQLQQIRPELSVVMMTGYTEENIVEALQASQISVISKPFHSRELLEYLRNVLDHSHLHR